MTFAIDMTAKMFNIFPPLKYFQKADLRKEAFDNWMLKEFVPVYRRMMDGLTPGVRCSPARARRKVEEFTASTSNMLFLADVPAELRMWFMNLENAMKDQCSIPPWEVVEKADKALKDWANK